MVEQDFPQGLTFRRILQVGHFLHQEQPERVNRKIVEWLTLNDERLATRG
jgi:pimeloyl-ACP methyl ester carboxylesterase